MWHMHIFLTISFIHGNSLAQKITISDYNPTDSKTECTMGFISGTDHVVYNVAVDVAGSGGLQNKTVRFQTAKTSSGKWDHLCLVNLDHKCSQSQTAVCYCNQSEGTLNQLVINITASSKYSGGLIKGIIGVDIVSNIQNIPQIYDLSDVTFDVNGFNFSGDSNVLQLQNDESTVTFCCRDLPSPCRANIKHQQELVASGEPCAVYNISSTHQQGNLNLTLVYDICNQTKQINILFKNGFTQSNQENFVLIISLITTIIAMALLLIASISYIQSINRKGSIVQREKTERMYVISNDGLATPDGSLPNLTTFRMYDDDVQHNESSHTYEEAARPFVNPEILPKSTIGPTQIYLNIDISRKS